MSHKIDLHTHSEASHDGGMSLESYSDFLERDVLNYIAITDHNRIDFALSAQDKLGDKIIVGEEIMTQVGEVIGLFINQQIKPKQSLKKTIEDILSQGGLVYIPHPFETIRSGIQKDNLVDNVDKLDIIETLNGRALFGNKAPEAESFAKRHNIAQASSSDSHGKHGWGRSYTVISEPPTAENLVGLLRNANLIYNKPSLRAILYPKCNKIKKALS